jgi:hypothetical protein
VAKKSFVINTEPHVAEIAGAELLFKPEVMGDEFLDAYQGLQEGQRAAGIDPSDLAGMSVRGPRGSVSAPPFPRQPHAAGVCRAVRSVGRQGRGGRVVFARVVNHPGTRPNNFFGRALREGR